MVRKEDGNPSSAAYHMSFEDIAAAVGEATGEEPAKREGALARIHQALQPSLNEMFFTRRLVLVEGLEDVAYLQAYLNLLDRSDEFRRLGCHIVPANGKSELLKPLVICNHMKISTYLVFDTDTDKPDQNGSRAKHENDNKALFKLIGGDEATPFPDATVWGGGYAAWYSDIGTTVKDEIGADDWARYRNRADQEYGQVGNLRKNTLHIGASLAFAWEEGKRSESLNAVCEAILDQANRIPWTVGES